jgi:hypothetical protein
VSDREKSIRTWREIANEASREHDSKKLRELIDELERALELQKENRSSAESRTESSQGS